MIDQRRHQRIRFAYPPSIRIGYEGEIDAGTVENLSLSGVMVKTRLPLVVGRHFGCEFSLFGSPVIDVVAIVVSRVGSVFGARFEAGPIGEIVLDDAIDTALSQGHASILSNHETGGRRVMRVCGGLNASLHNDFMYSLTRVGVDEIDLSGVTAVDRAGIALCLTAVSRHGASIGQQSECFSRAWEDALRQPGKPGAVV